jgi:hypothetical protein
MGRATRKRPSTLDIRRGGQEDLRPRSSVMMDGLDIDHCTVQVARGVTRRVEQVKGLTMRILHPE